MVRGKLALINDTVVDVNENYAIVGLDNTYAYYSDGKLSEYKYSKYWRITDNITVLLEENSNDVIFLDKEGKVRCRICGFIQNHDMTKQLKELGDSFSAQELLDGCHTKNKRNSQSYNNISLSKKMENGVIRLDLMVNWSEYSSLIDAEKFTWILPLGGAYQGLTSEKLGYRIVAEPDSYGVDVAWHRTVQSIIDRAGNRKFGPVDVKLKRLNSKGDLYSYCNKEDDLDCGILRVDSTGKLVKIFESDNDDYKYYNDDFIMVAEQYGNMTKRDKRYSIINKLGDRVFDFYIYDVEDTKGVNDIVCRYRDKDYTERKAVITPNSRTIQIYDNNCKFTRVAFKVLKVTLPNGEVRFYEDGKEYTSMAFKYINAKKLYMPLCEETLYGAVDVKLDWYATDRYGEPIDKEPYDSFESIQADFRNKIARPLDRKVVSYRVM